MTRAEHSEHDAIVIGGGPGGSAAAATLAASGLDVLVLERSRFPRFHIGESMLAYGAALLHRLGVDGELRRIGFPVKLGAEFTSEDGRFQRVDFTDQGGTRVQATWQVERSEFDHVLIRQAASCGATVREESHVTDVLTNSGGRIIGVAYVHAGRQHEARSRIVLDASGRAGVIVNQYLRARTINPKLRMVALFKHWAEVDEATNPGVEGDIVIGSHQDGWIWAIPIRKDRLSVGAVTLPGNLRGADRERLYAEHVGRISRVHQRLADAVPATELKGESDFSYFTETVAGDGFFVVGDAGCFVDPIFSAGAYLALATGIKAGELSIRVLAGDLPRERAVDLYSRFYKTGYDSYFRLIYAYYDHGYRIGSYLKSTGVWVEPGWVARLLGGDFWSRKNPLAEHLRANERYATFAPFEPLYGCPVYADLESGEPESSPLGRPRLPTRTP